MAKASSLRKPVPTARPVENLIHIIRGQKVMLDADLAMLYQVPTGRLNEAVKRNLERFPEDFMLRLTKEEVALMISQIAISSEISDKNQSVRSLRSQIAILKKGRGQHSKYAVYAFTEHGVAMLSAVLRSERAVQMSLSIIRAFVRMRELIASNKDIAVRVEKLERSHDRVSSIIEVLAEDIDRVANEVKQMKITPLPPKRKIDYIFHEG